MFSNHYFNLTEYLIRVTDVAVQWEFELTPVYSAVTAVVVFILGVKIVRVLFSNDWETIRSHGQGHNWKNTTTYQPASYCNICKRLMMPGEGMYCDCCGIYAGAACTSVANQTDPCKAISLNPVKPMQHHWVKGNLPPGSLCKMCGEEFVENGLKNFKCCWCLRTVHTDCKPYASKICDFGCYKSMIIPPTSVETVSKRSSIKKYLVLKSIAPTNWPDWSPLIVIANCKSGNNDGAEILSIFRGLLHPGQVVDLKHRRPEAAIQLCKMLGKVQCKILVAGGDGTIGWVLNTIAKANMQVIPAVGVLPLGTGNDLSRVLGWGRQISSPIDPTFILDEIMKAQTVLFDRWKVEIKSKRSLSLPAFRKELFMYNYLSIGVDAQVTLDFHKARESRFYIFSSRMFNKLLYLGYGTQQFIEKKYQGLNEKIELYLDGEKKKLPSVESIVILNIDSWGAGVRLWQMSEENDNRTEQSYNDGKLEVLALFSSLHIAQLQVGLGAPYRVGQASNIRIILKSATAVQADGEPWFQLPAEFNISYYNQALMLKRLRNN